MSYRTNDLEYNCAKWCNDNGIIIYPVPVSAYSKESYYIVVERNGKPKKGERIFKNEPYKDDPSVWDQVRTLYRMIYEKSNKQ